MRRGNAVLIDGEQRKVLEGVAKDGKSAQKLALRARIVLLGGDGVGVRETARQLGTSTPTVLLWRKRFREAGVPGVLHEAPRPGRPRSLSSETVAGVVRRTTQEKPEAATHWSTRTLAPIVGLSHTQIHRIWRAHGLKPHRQSIFKLSRDPKFVEKLTDVVGLYLNPPEKAVVFSIDEKTQVQALDRTQPGLPMKKGRAGTMTHDYKRHGTTTLFAALNIAEGDVIAECLPKHRHQEFLTFLKKVDRAVPQDLDLHAIIDNYSAHKHENVAAWLAEHPRVHLHFVPTSSSWLNLVERFFAEITDKAIRRGIFTSVKALEAAITNYIEHRNRNPRPFTWTATIDEILAKVGRAQSALDSVKDTSVTVH